MWIKLKSRFSIRNIISILFLIIMAGIAVFYYIRHKDDFHLISTVTVEAIVIVSVLVTINFLCYGFQLKILTDHYGLRLTFTQWFGLSRLSGFTYLFLPFPSGASLKALYLKKIFGLQYSSFVASMAAATLIKLAVFSFFSILLLFPLRGHTIHLFVIVGVVFIGTVAFLLFGYTIHWPYFSSTNPVATIMKEWGKIRMDLKMISRLIMLSCLIFVTSSLSIYFSFKTFSIHTSIFSCGVILTLTAFTSALRLVPADLGLKEVIFVGISSIVGVGLNEGFHAAVFHRIIGIVFTLLLAPGFAYNLFRKSSFPQKSLQSDDRALK